LIYKLKEQSDHTKYRAVFYIAIDDDKLLISLPSAYYMERIYLKNVALCSLVGIFGGLGENCCHHVYSNCSNSGWHCTNLNKFSTSND
jgi:hypothetical protein